MDIISQEKIANNIAQVFLNPKSSSKYSYLCEIRSLNEKFYSIPKVVSIKQTIYRVEKNSEIIKLLCKAAQSGKEVLVVVELKAKFDEEHNIKISKLLENSGVKVTYGILGFKTHGKALLVIRRENKKLIKYTHLSTGNYNKKTAKTYTDYGLITSDIDIGNDNVVSLNDILLSSPSPNTSVRDTPETLNWNPYTSTLLL